MIASFYKSREGEMTMTMRILNRNSSTRYLLHLLSFGCYECVLNLIIWWWCHDYDDDVMIMMVMIKALKSEVSHLQGKHVEDE